MVTLIRLARGAAGLLQALSELEVPPRVSGLRVSLLAVSAGTHAFALRILTRAARRLRLPVPTLPVRIPLASDRTDPAWYRTRALPGSVRLELLRGFMRLAVAELPLLEEHVGRRPSPRFLKRGTAWDARLPAGEFRRAAKRWMQLLTGNATWLALRLAEVAVRATGDAGAAREVLSVCAAVSVRRRLYDPFNTFAAFLEAFHLLARRHPLRLARLIGTAGFRRVALRAGAGKQWSSRRARELVGRVT
jgi:hypothetical protein